MTDLHASKPRWNELVTRLDDPGYYIRIRRGEPLVVLTPPARWALCITPDGRIEICSLQGVSGVPFGPWPQLTKKQQKALRRLGL
jgi:hypothetical protein